MTLDVASAIIDEMSIYSIVIFFPALAPPILKYPNKNKNKKNKETKSLPRTDTTLQEN